MQQGETSNPHQQGNPCNLSCLFLHRENLNWYSFRANHFLRSPESQFSDNLNNQPGLRWKPQRVPGWEQHIITNLPDFANKWSHYSRPFHHSTGFGLTASFLMGPHSYRAQKSCTSVSRLLERFAQPSAKDQKRNNEWVRVSEHNHPADY